MVEHWFSREKSESMRPFTEQAANELVDEMLKQQKPVDLMEAYARPLPFKVCC
jgi:cytochrome P450